MGTYGFAQFQIDVRKADDEMKRAIDEFKRQNRTVAQKEMTSEAPEADASSSERVKE